MVELDASQLKLYILAEPAKSVAEEVFLICICCNEIRYLTIEIGPYTIESLQYFIWKRRFEEVARLLATDILSAIFVMCRESQWSGERTTSWKGSNRDRDAFANRLWTLMNY